MIHPDDVLLFESTRALMFRVAKKYDLRLVQVIPEPRPEYKTSALGTCNAGGVICLTMRGMSNGVWDTEPRRAKDVRNTAAHELAHLRHMDHSPAFQEFEEEMQEAVANQSEDHREKVLRRLVKMQAQRDGEAKLGNEKAAEAFAAAVNRMMLEYELKPSDLDYQRSTQDDPVIELMFDHKKHGTKAKHSRIAWEESLARVVAKANLCSFLIRSGSNAIWFVGTRSHATVAEYTYGILVREATKLADKEYLKFFYRCQAEGDVTRARGFRAAWLDAFVGRVRERLEDERQQMVRDIAADLPPGSASTALLRIDNALVKTQAYIDQKFARKRKYAAALNGGRCGHQDGRAWGRAAADRMALGRRGVGAGGARGALRG